MCLRNAMIPVVTIMGLQFGNLITSAIVIENVFVLPGIGRLVFQAIANRDLIVVRDVVMFLSAMVIAINFLIDILYAWIDPRLQAGVNTLMRSNTPVVQGWSRALTIASFVTGLCILLVLIFCAVVSAYLVTLQLWLKSTFPINWPYPAQNIGWVRTV
jgi:hypothetical protein